MVKALAVLTCLAGVVLLALADEKGHRVVLSAGILVEVFCAFTQAFYYVAFRKWALRNGNMPPSIVAIITGLEGVAHIAIFSLGLLILDVTAIERFEWPANDQLRTLSIGATLAFSGNVALMEALVLLPNPLLVSVATLMTTPVNWAADYMIHSADAKKIGTFKIFGGLIIVATFGIVIVRDHYLLNLPVAKRRKSVDADRTVVRFEQPENVDE